ncbi:ABC-2 type transport system ATP-binding protein [Dehalogenimonas formicexedens]|uniref:ABC-2 type transport system ATP-binding protein n=1 Tax=Dehalogenimonas formicexedens TaxID=1839801 RepID=A0A1P8F798_9CHLR|nr:ABC transporter ATP-binding protein [Dehalogenimonas formicexedens]APV44349.1 ABC-2 type transport system ATP-binding protein [Dehalogenimonas formicexedens]
MIASDAVSIFDVSFKYGHLTVIDHLSLKIPQGQAFGLLGPNGAGKTTLIRLMAGLLQPDEGSIQVLNEPLTRKRSSIIGYMPQTPSVYQELSVRQNVEFFAKIYGMAAGSKRKTRVEEVIKIVDLWPKRDTSAHELSGGMRQRLSLACAIVHNPSIIFLDEPTVGLDPELRVHFWDYFRKLTAAGHTLIISSHTMDDATHCDCLVFLREGKVIARGSPSELKEAVGDPEASLEDAFLYFIRKGANENA